MKPSGDTDGIAVACHVNIFHHCVLVRVFLLIKMLVCVQLQKPWFYDMKLVWEDFPKMVRPFQEFYSEILRPPPPRFPSQSAYLTHRFNNCVSITVFRTI